MTPAPYGGGQRVGVWPGRNHKYILVGNLLLWPLDFLSFTYGCPWGQAVALPCLCIQLMGLPMSTI